MLNNGEGMQERGGVVLKLRSDLGIQNRHAPFWKLAEPSEEGATSGVSAARKSSTQ